MTYQGQLRQAGEPFDGTADLRFSLFDASSGSGQIGPTLQSDALPIAEGLFTIDLDFGSNVFDGSERWLEIAVRVPPGGATSSRSPRASH
jgi:hypothetical protein